MVPKTVTAVYLQVERSLIFSICSNVHDVINLLLHSNNAYFLINGIPFEVVSSGFNMVSPAIAPLFGIIHKVYRLKLCKCVHQFSLSHIIPLHLRLFKPSWVLGKERCQHSESDTVWVWRVWNILCLAKHSSTGKPKHRGTVSWWRNQSPKVLISAIFATYFPTNTIRCQCNRTDLQFDLVEQIYNVQLQRCWEK
jgi:hypothetical protein